MWVASFPGILPWMIHLGTRKKYIIGTRCTYSLLHVCAVSVMMMRWKLAYISMIPLQVKEQEVSKQLEKRLNLKLQPVHSQHYLEIKPERYKRIIHKPAVFIVVGNVPNSIVECE